MSTRQLCPYCQYANELENQFCGQCGKQLGGHIPAGSRSSAITVGNGSLLPAPSLKQVGQAVAVSLVALAAEAGLILLRRRLNHLRRPAAPAEPQALVPQQPQTQPRTVLSQRIVQVWQNGRLTGRLSEQSIWQELE
jgi:hypothetical protein